MSPFPESAKVSPEVHQILLMRGGNYSREQDQVRTSPNTEHREQSIRLQLQLAWKVPYMRIQMWENELTRVISNHNDTPNLTLQPTRTAQQEREGNKDCYFGDSDADSCSSRSIILTASTASIAAESLAQLLQNVQAIHWVTLMPELLRLQNEITTALLQSNILPSGSLA